ncbi:CARDB domain-containing protein [Endozoicomonas sp. G2_1]|uniref:CARDB domain-containing protein n=1 Tax=Endozoicomonas sp. G2_1 TaxID=2821091 RepID=UPI001AD952BB
MSTLFALSAISLATSVSAESGYVTDNIFLDLRLNVPNPVVELNMQNNSASTKLKDFTMGYSSDEVTFSGLTAVKQCGYSKYISFGVRRKSYIDKEHTQVWLGTGGQPDIEYYHQYDRGDYYDGIAYPAVIPETWQLRNANNLNSLSMIGRAAAPFDFNIPVASLRHPKGEATPAIDGETLFNQALQQHIENGGDRLEFFKQNHSFSIDVPLTLAASCSIKAPDYIWPYDHDWDPTTPFFSYSEVPVTIRYNYIGDPKLEYTPKVELGDDGGILNPLLIETASISVDPPISTGKCPRKVTATASIALNNASNVTRKLRYRFIENGKPVTSWKQKSFVNTDLVLLTHKISILPAKSEGKGSLASNNIQAIDNGGLQSLGNNLTLNQKPIIAVEVQLDGQSKMVSTHYKAYCSAIKTTYLSPDIFGRKVDLVLRGDLILGQTMAPWGSTIELSLDDASAITERGCSYRYAYNVFNTETDNATQFSTSIAAGGLIRKKNDLAGLNGYSSTFVNGSVTLPAGKYSIFAQADTFAEVDETLENNNKAKMKLIVPKQCGGSIRR